MKALQAAIAAILFGVASSPAGAQQIGRLFHSAAERSALDSLRRTKPAPKPAAPRASPDPQSTRLDGYVVRSDGKSTLWVNGSAVSGTR